MHQQDQKVPENKKFINQKADTQHQISMKLIAETSLDQSVLQKVSEQQKIQLILKLKSVHLQWLNIKTIQNLQVFEHLNVLYLQHITKIEGLDHLINLQYLALNDNRISKIQNIFMLNKLQGLNLSNNYIEEIGQKQLPPNLQLLSLKNNPVCLDVDYKSRVLRQLKSLDLLDDIKIAPTDRFKILGIFPQNLNSYANQMRQFYSKKQVQKKLKQQKEMVLLNTVPVDQKNALGQIRAKTRKYLHENQQTFKQESEEQVSNFNEKIEVSRKIRSIKEQEERERGKRLALIKESNMQELMHGYK